MLETRRARSAPPRATVPRDDGDLYSDEGILAPYPHYRRLRQLGPVVWLRRHRVYAVTTYAECKAVLLDDASYTSGHGVALNAVTNALSGGTTLSSDGAEHAARRTLLAHRLTPRALRTMREQVDTAAGRVVEAAVGKRHVDGVADLAVPVPVAVVPDLVGWPAEGREDLLRWAGATFDVLGPRNARAARSAGPAVAMLRYARRVVRRRSVLPGSMAADVLAAADAGRVSVGECPALMVDYLAPSLDTTISAIASAVHLFARHPEQWQLLRSRRDLLPGAVNEVVRVESPLRGFSRRVAHDTTLAGVPLPAGCRVLVLYASANRDEREWDHPDRFDITRDAARQLGFGHGTHGCAGQGLARLETTAVLGHLLDRVERIVPAGEPTWGLNNIIHTLDHLPVELVAQGAS